jgi:hypothetical protein
MGLYVPQLSEVFGDVPVRDIGLLASEGRVSIPVEDGTPAGILDVRSTFFEFVPKDCIDQESPPTFRTHEVEVGQEYYVLMTTSSGLYRYDLHDVVRITGFFHETPMVEFLNKGQHISSLSGEKITERQAIEAMEVAARVAGVRVCNFVLAPRWSDPPHYMLHIEQGPQDGRARRLVEAFDEQMGRINIEYASKRHSGRLGAVRLNLLPENLLAEMDQHEAESKRRGNEQYKHRYLYSAPGQDSAFPVREPELAEPHADSRSVSRAG